MQDDLPLVGQIVHIFKTSRNMVWLNVRVRPDQSNYRDINYLTVLLKLDGVISSWKELKCKLGDSLSLVGKVQHKQYSTQEITRDHDLEEHSVFLASQLLQVMERWDPATPFVPIPPPQRPLEDGLPSKPAEICKYYVNTQRCHHGSSCRNIHPPPEELKALRDACILSKKQAKIAMAPTINGGDFSATDKRSKLYKLQFFTDFLITTFGLPLLQSGTLLDIAGGRGQIAIELWIQHGVRALVVDPRPDCCRPMKHQHRRLAKLPGPPGYTHLPSWFDTHLFPAENAELLAAAPLLYGLHPDQATEPLVQVALSLGKPFAVVPCCVFGAENPDRLDPEGLHVNTYEQYVRYLMAKDSRIQKAYLPFEGRNVVLWLGGAE